MWSRRGTSGYFVPFVTPLVKFFGARFVAQDQQTMVEQARGLRSNPGLDADRRCGQASEVVFRAEAAAIDRQRRASAGRRSGGTALAKLAGWPVLRIFAWASSIADCSSPGPPSTSRPCPLAYRRMVVPKVSSSFWALASAVRLCHVAKAGSGKNQGPKPETCTLATNADQAHRRCRACHRARRRSWRGPGCGRAWQRRATTRTVRRR